MNNLTVVVLCTNEKKFLEKNLSSLFNQSVKPKQIYLLDNNSSDGSVEYVKKKFPGVKIIENKKNLGYARANNIGLKTAFKEGSDLCLVLNCDTFSDKNMVRELLNTYNGQKNHNSKIGLIQPVILLGKNPRKINTVGNAIHYLGYGYCKDYLKNYRASAKDKEIISVSGAAMLFSRQFFNDVGGFDESFYMYNEDQDLSWRAALLGYHHRLSSKAVIYHYYNFSRHARKMFNSEKNRLQMIFKNYSLKTIVLLSPAFFFNELFVLVYSLFCGWFVDKIRSYAYFLKNFKDIKKERKTVQGRRKISDHELFGFFESGLDFEPVNNPIIRYIINPLYVLYYLLVKKLV